MIRLQLGGRASLVVSGAPYASDCVPQSRVNNGTATAPVFSWCCTHSSHNSVRYLTFNDLAAAHVNDANHVVARFADNLVLADSPRGTGTICNLITTLD